MGKSPGRWIKSLLLGKKSSKSNLSKGKEKLYAAEKEEGLVSSKVAVSDFSVDPLSIAAPIAETVSRNGVNLEDISANLPKDGVNAVSIEKDGDHAASSNLCSQEVPEKFRLEEAATKAQAAFRGYLARRAFRTLKGIIRLQALIRGHLVRRQAVATLCSAWGIIKFQALVRGQKVRRADIAIEVQKIYPRALLGAKSCSELSASARVKNLSHNAFVRKFLSSSSTVMPLRLQYGPGEPNSAREWLERWMKSHFWEPSPQPLRILVSKSQVKDGHKKNDQGKTKQTIRKLSNGKVEIGSRRATLEHEKPKRHPRKVSTKPADQAREQPQNKIEKVKRNLRKIPDSTKEVSGRAEINNEIPNQTQEKSLASNAADVCEGDSAEKRNVVSVALSKPSNLEENLTLLSGNDSVVESSTSLAVDTQPTESNAKVENTPDTIKELSSKDGNISSESLNTSQRRASLPEKIDNQENGVHSTQKVPSYMASTESVKAKLRGQSSPRFSLDVVEKNGMTRRHSLPSSTNSGLSSLSPSAQRLVQAAGKGAVRNDKSLSSSRDAGDKFTKAEWRR
ncbi:hypothetical protein SLA2020_113090 [Shorea laevis]